MKDKKRLRNMGTFLLFGGPSFFVFTAVVLIPFFYGLYLTFTNWSVATGDSTFIGFSNYIKAFNDQAFLTSLWFTFKYVFFCVILSNGIAFLIALTLTKNTIGTQIARAGFFTPNLIGGIVLGYLWFTLFSQVLPYIGNEFGWEILQRSWLGNPDQAFWALVIASVWQLVGYLIIIYIAGLNGVPRDVLEAADIDGANGIQKLAKIILPLSIPAIVICIFISITRSFLAYDINLSLTKGGPYNSTEMVSYHIVQKAFLSNDYGTGQAQAIVLFVVVAFIALSQTYLLKKREVEA